MPEPHYEWRTVLIRHDGIEELGNWTTEKNARSSMAIDLAWFEEGDAVWCGRYKTVRLERRPVYPPEVMS